MANYDFAPGSLSLPMDGSRKHFIIKNLVNCYDSVANGGLGTAVAAGNTFTIFNIKEGWFVRRIWYRIVKLGTIGATTLATIGTVASATDWETGVNTVVGTGGTLNTALGTLVGGTNGLLDGALYLADTDLAIVFGVANFDGKIEFAAEVVDVFGGSTIV